MATTIRGRDRFSRFWSTASGFWRGKSALSSWPLTICLLVIGVSQLAVQYRLNYWNRDFFNALGLRDAGRLWHEAMLFVPLACLSISLSVCVGVGSHDDATKMARVADDKYLEQLVVAGAVPAARIRNRRIPERRISRGCRYAHCYGRAGRSGARICDLGAYCTGVRRYTLECRRQPDNLFWAHRRLPCRAILLSASASTRWCSPA